MVHLKRSNAKPQSTSFAVNGTGSNYWGQEKFWQAELRRKRKLLLLPLWGHSVVLVDDIGVWLKVGTIIVWDDLEHFDEVE